MHSIEGPFLQLSHSKPRVRGQIRGSEVRFARPLAGGCCGEAAGLPSPSSGCCSPWRMSRRMRPEGGPSRAPGSLPPRILAPGAGPDSVLSAPGSCPILSSVPIPERPHSAGVLSDLSPASALEPVPGTRLHLCGCPAWEEWGAHLACGGPSPLPRHVWRRDWPLPGASRPACGRQRGHGHSSWQHVRKEVPPLRTWS